MSERPFLASLRKLLNRHQRAALRRWDEGLEGYFVEGLEECFCVFTRKAAAYSTRQ